MKPDAAIYVWHAHVQQPVIAAAFEKHGLLLHQVLVWVKPTSTFGHSYYRWRYEPCAFGWKKGHKPNHGLGKLESVWEVDWEGKSRVVGNEHPTMKPLRLFEIPMEQHTQLGQIVLDTFSGSGSKILAAERLGRKCRALEIQPAFVDVAIRRWEKAAGKKAYNEGTNLDFEEAAAMAGVSRVRLSQIMNLLDLEPGIQEGVMLGENQVAERRLRGMAKRAFWAERANKPIEKRTSHSGL